METEGAWGSQGRIGIYTCNFGTVAPQRGYEEGSATALAGLSSLLVGVQESSAELMATMMRHQWLCSDGQFVRERTSGGDGLLVAAMPSQTARLITHTAHSGSRGSVAERSSQLFVTAVFKWGVAGVGHLTMANFHLHKDLARRGVASPNVAAWARQFGEGLRACGARIVVGDANMLLVALSEAMQCYCGLDVQLVASHKELSVSTPVDLTSQRGVEAALRLDSCGIWVVGGVRQVRALSVDAQCLAGAMHPAFLEFRAGRLVAYNRGYRLHSYSWPRDRDDPTYRRACAVPKEETLLQIAELWRAHDMRRDEEAPLGQRRWTWELDPATLSAEGWQRVATALPKPGEEWQAPIILRIIALIIIVRICLPKSLYENMLASNFKWQAPINLNMCWPKQVLRDLSRRCSRAWA